VRRPFLAAEKTMSKKTIDPKTLSSKDYKAAFAEIDLTRKQMKLLRHHYHAKGRQLTARELAAVVWSTSRRFLYEIITTRALRFSQLRRPRRYST
jgi:hypothetical protein